MANDYYATQLSTGIYSTDSVERAMAELLLSRLPEEVKVQNAILVN